MYIVGIDIAKRKHEAAVIDGEGTVIIKPFSFTNNCSGYNRLLAMLTKAKLPLDEVSFAMEATGHYWLALFTRLQKEGFRVQVINPVQTNSIRSFYIRQVKTDPRDALLIAEVIRFGHFSESTLHPENIYELRELCRGRHAIVSMQADVKRKVVALLDQVFPEYETAFTNLFGDTSMAILQTCPTPKELSETPLEELCHLIEVSSHKRFRMAKAHNLSQIGDIVEKDQILARVDDVPVYASLTGVLRGIIRDGYEVPKGMKIADIDPRQEQKKNCDTISDKARCIAGSVVEILLSEGVLP